MQLTSVWSEFLSGKLTRNGMGNQWDKLFSLLLPFGGSVVLCNFSENILHEPAICLVVICIQLNNAFPYFIHPLSLLSSIFPTFLLSWDYIPTKMLGPVCFLQALSSVEPGLRQIFLQMSHID